MVLWDLQVTSTGIYTPRVLLGVLCMFFEKECGIARVCPHVHVRMTLLPSTLDVHYLSIRNVTLLFLGCARDCDLQHEHILGTVW